MKNLSVMIKPASSGCNLRCRYCFYADVAEHRQVASFGRMTKETMQGVLANIRRDLIAGDRIQFAFQGGEPTLAGLDFFREFVQQVEKTYAGIGVSYALQTNGILLEENWFRFLKQKGFLVGLSLDLLSQCHDEARVDSQGRGTFAQVVKTLEGLNRYGVEYNVLCTLTNPVARHPRKVWKQIENLDLKYVQFTPCLDDLEAKGGVYALTPERFGSFYSQLFRLWLEAFQKGNYRSIKLFDDVVNLLAYGIPTGCGMDGQCRQQLVVEADGSVYPCDFYCLDVYKTGNLAQQSLREVYESPVNQIFTRRAHSQPKICSGCPYWRICGGNCKRLQTAFCGEQMCGYRQFLEEALPALQQIARQQRGRR